MSESIAYARTNALCAIIPYEKEREIGIRKVLQSTEAKSFGIFIGPEGGFTEEEIEEALHQGVHSVSLGNRILRSETASLVTLANIMYEMGEMG